MGGGGAKLLLCYSFRIKFQGGQRFSGGRPCPPVEESQLENGRFSCSKNEICSQFNQLKVSESVYGLYFQ